MNASNPWPFAPLERGAYDVIAADPPWHFRGRTTIESDRSAANHYGLMSLEAIKALPVVDLAAADCWLFLWCTDPMIPQALDVMRAWGFAYSTKVFTWVKLKRGFKWRDPRIFVERDFHTGLGFTSRKNSESVLLGRRGKPARAAKDVHEIILSPVREHSRKPEEFRRRVERLAGPDARRAELFAREPRRGWEAWGNEVGKFAKGAQ